MTEYRDRGLIKTYEEIDTLMARLVGCLSRIPEADATPLPSITLGTMKKIIEMMNVQAIQKTGERYRAVLSTKGIEITDNIYRLGSIIDRIDDLVVCLSGPKLLSTLKERQLIDQLSARYTSFLADAQRIGVRQEHLLWTKMVPDYLRFLRDMEVGEPDGERDLRSVVAAYGDEATKRRAMETAKLKLGGRPRGMSDESVYLADAMIELERTRPDLKTHRSRMGELRRRFREEAKSRELFEIEISTLRHLEATKSVDSVKHLVNQRKKELGE